MVQSMAAIVLCLFRFLRLLGSGHQAVALENVALRRQLAAFRRKRRRPILTEWDRLFWIGLARVWTDWKGALILVQPDTVLRWQRDRFRRYWAALSRSKDRPRGRPALGSGSAPADSSDGRGQSAVARAPNSWGTQDVGDRGLGTHGVSRAAHNPTATIPDLEDVSEKPPE